MSQFANYALHSRDYDTTRVPVGLEIVLGCLVQSGVPLGQQTVLEAGCGTGNYLQALLPELGSLVGVDSSEQMLAVAGFDVVLAVVDLHGVLQGTSYLDTQGPLLEEWRAGDSTWLLASEAELVAAQDRVETMHRQETIDQFLARREDLRRKIGQSTFLCGRK